MGQSLNFLVVASRSECPPVSILVQDQFFCCNGTTNLQSGESARFRLSLAFVYYEMVVLHRISPPAAASELGTFTLDWMVMLLRTDYTDIMKSITALCWCFLSTSCDAITKFNGIFVILTIIIFLSVVGFLARLHIMSQAKRGFCLVIIRGGDHLST